MVNEMLPQRQVPVIPVEKDEGWCALGSPLKVVWESC